MRTVDTATRLLSFWLADVTRPCRTLLRALTSPEVVSHHGVLMPICDDWPSARRRSLCSGRHERRFALIVQATLRPDDVVMELGAGLGFISTLCAKRIGSQKVFTFEANPALIPFIKRVYSLNAVSPSLVNAAIGTADGEATFHVSGGIVSSSLIRSGAEQQSVTVRQVHINTALAAIRPTFVISDIEGSEGSVFEVADLDGVRIIAVEMHQKALGEEGLAKLISTLGARGFREIRWLSSRRKRLFERRR